MKGVTYLTNENNEKVAVQIDLRKNQELWSAFCDFIEAKKRLLEPTKEWSKIKDSLVIKKLI
ncbi:MAG: hypothetical protein LKG19_02415 [Saprospiraceae bacterium]|jgi:hypothetical protein|nr:hypothetical protein [Saprospiraceae bacterium]